MSDPILPEVRSRPLTARCQAEYDQVLRRFDRYRATLPEPLPPLAESVRTFLAALPGSARCKPRWALQRRYPDLPWRTMPQRDRPGQGARLPRVRVEPPVEPHPGRRIVTALTARHYRQLVRRFEASPANGHATPEARIRAYLAGLRPSVAHASHQALHWQYPDLEWRTIPKPPRGSRNVPRLRRTLMGAEEREQFRASLTSPRSAALCEMFFVLRRFEAAGRYWADVDFQEGAVTFIGKGNRPRLSLLPERTLVALAEWYVEAGCPSLDTPVFPGPTGQPLSPGRVSNLVRERLRAAGVYRAYRGAHAWRRSWATAYLRANPDDLMGLREALGHADIGTTQNYIYFDTDLDMRPRVSRVRL